MESAAPPLSPPSSRPLPPPLIPLLSRQNQIPIAANQPSNVVPTLPPPSLEGFLDVSVLLAARCYQSSQTVGTDHLQKVHHERENQMVPPFLNHLVSIQRTITMSQKCSQHKGWLVSSTTAQWEEQCGY
ncbi:unnamed protein product [Musa textilis]